MSWSLENDLKQRILKSLLGFWSYFSICFSNKNEGQPEPNQYKIITEMRKAKFGLDMT
jgi:hypothetical protein